MDHPEECLIIGFSPLGVVQMPHKFNAVKGGVNLDHFGGAKVDQLVKG